jgi:hypothetical protein
MGSQGSAGVIILKIVTFSVVARGGLLFSFVPFYWKVGEQCYTHTRFNKKQYRKGRVNLTCLVSECDRDNRNEVLTMGKEPEHLCHSFPSDIGDLFNSTA